MKTKMACIVTLAPILVAFHIHKSRFVRRRLWLFGALAAIMAACTATHLETSGHPTALSAATAGYNDECELVAASLTNSSSAPDKLASPDTEDLVHAIYGHYYMKNMLAVRLGEALFLGAARKAAQHADLWYARRSGKKRTLSKSLQVVGFTVVVMASIRAILVRFLLCYQFDQTSDVPSLSAFSGRVVEVWHDFHPPSSMLVRLTHSVTYLTFVLASTADGFTEVVDWRIFDALLHPLNDVAHAIENPELGCARALFEFREVCSAGASHTTLRNLMAYPLNYFFLSTGHTIPMATSLMPFLGLLGSGPHITADGPAAVSDSFWPWVAGCITPMLLAALSLIIPFFVFEWLIRQDWCKPYLITYRNQPRWRDGKPNSGISQQDLVWKAVTKTSALAVGGAFVLFFLRLPMFNLQELQRLPTVTEGAWQFACIFVVSDFFTYAIHWAFHKSDFLWKRVHAFHHQVHTPTGLTTTFATFWDSAINGVVPLILGAAMVQPHPLIFYASICFIVSNFVAIHSGVDAPWLRVLCLTFLPFRAVVRLHDKHHRISGRSATNLGTLTTFWDWLFGTLD